MADVKTPPRRLVDLHPDWWSESMAPQRGLGIIFDCPCLAEGCAWGGRVAVAFSNPLDDGAPSDFYKTKWTRTGDTFETLTLHPSLHLVGHWHGWIRGGMVESC